MQAFIKPWDGFCGPLEVRTHPLPPPDSDCVIQDVQPTVVSSFGCFVFEILGASFSFLGASFSSFGCFVFEFWVLRFRSWVLRFRVLGASFSSFGCFVLRSSLSSASFSKLPVCDAGYNFYRMEID